MPIDTSRLQVSLEEGERWRRTLSITVPAEVVQAERRAAVRKLSSRVKIPGFRAGKVPDSVVEKRFGPVLERELLDQVIGEAYRGALSQQGLRPISEGEVGSIEYQPASDLSFEISFEVAPRIELARLGGFRVTRPGVEIEEDAVDRVLERLREQHGTWRPASEGTPEEGDMVAVRIRRLTGEDPDEEPRRYEFTLGRGEAIPDVEAAIRSLEVGAHGTFTVSFPAEAEEGDTANPDELEITLESRKVMQKPELDDEFASLVGEFDSLDDLRALVRDDLERETREEAEAAVRSQLLDRVLEANPFEVPDAMVDQYVRSVFGDNAKPTDEEVADAKERFGDQAAHAVKRFLAVEEIARSQGLAATEEELDERVQEIAERTGTEPGETYARLQKSGALERLEREITDRKVFDFLERESTIEEGG